MLFKFLHLSIFSSFQQFQLSIILEQYKISDKKFMYTLWVFLQILTKDFHPNCNFTSAIL